jgi:hypothetical protein
VTKVFVILFSLFLGACALSGQTGAAPPPGDPTVFYMFLRHHDALAQDVKALAATDPARASNTQVGAAASMNLGVNDFMRIGPVYQQLESELEAVNAKANAYRDAVVSGSTTLDIAIIKGFTASRNEAIARARARLQSALTPAGWQALSAYIDGEFRNGVRVFGRTR